ncbi:pentapeptide repeat-containing protein [soil metagenome]
MIPAGLAAAVALGAAVIVLPRLIAHGDCPGCGSSEIAKPISDSRAALLQLIVVLAGGVTVYFTWKNYSRSVEEAKVNVALAREGRASDTFVKAVEQLGSQSRAVRAGGAVGLGRLLKAAATDGDYWPIMDVLTTFVRDQAPWDRSNPHDWKPSQDVQSALNVLARRSATVIPQRHEEAPVDLHECDLKLAWMAEANLQGALLTSSRLVEVDLSRAKLNGADLRGADLTNAKLQGADLSDAKVTSDQLAKALGDAQTKLPTGLSPPVTWV